jgi:Domain of unknown function (DUF4267)
MTKTISISIAFLTGLGLIFLGVRFLLSPDTAETDFGIKFNEQSDYSFHYIKGIRDLFTGLIICIFILTKQTKALGITLLVGAIIPTVDMLIVLGKDYNSITPAISHIVAIIICTVLGIFFLLNKHQK